MKLTDAVALLVIGTLMLAVAAVILAQVPTSKPKKTEMSAAEAARHLGALLALSDDAAAIAAYKKSIALDPDNQGAWRMLEILLERTGDKAGAAYAVGQVERCAQQ